MDYSKLIINEMPTDTGTDDLTFSDDKSYNTQPTRPEPELWKNGLKDTKIQREDYTDPNFVRKHLWEISGKPKTKITLWAYNGGNFGSGTFLGKLDVYCTTQFYPEMAKAMAKLYPKSTAIFIAGKQKKMALIWINGKVLEKPQPFSHKSHNNDPYNDWGFMNMLPSKLDKVAKEVEHTSAEASFAAWVNTETKVVYQFSSKKQSHLDILHTKPELFGIKKQNQTVLQAKLEAEQNGWAMLEFEKSAGGPMKAIVIAMNLEQAKTAALILNKYRNYKNWNWLSIRTNDKNITLRTKQQILEFLTGRKAEAPTTH